MNNITEEMIDSYAEKLLIGLTDEERKMIQAEFSDIEKNMEINKEVFNIENCVIELKKFYESIMK